MARKRRFDLPGSALAAYLLTALPISLATPVVAAGTPFPADTLSLVEVGSIEGLPADVKKILGRQKTGVEGIADKWDRFNATDVINNQLPMRRFITGGASPSSAVVAYEQGGIGYSIQAAAFALQRSGWTEVGQWTLHERPSALYPLLALIDSQHYATRPVIMRPIRRDGPLRELNVSDEEVREIQSIALNVFPGAIVNISGVVSGCSCEEGSSCSDQVWIVAHRTGHSQGLQLSRVNGRWGIGVVQQWWLNFEELQVVRRTAPEVYDEALHNLYESYPVCVNKADGAQ
jgi:hypothetical protein